MRTDSLLPGIGIFDNDELGLIVFGTASGAPGSLATAAGRFAGGCVLIDTTSGKIYSNLGTVAVPSWNAVSDITPTEISLADGRILIGDAAGFAAEQVLSGDVTVNNAGVTAIGAQKVLETMIKDGAVTLDKIFDAAVTTIKLNDGAVTAIKLGATFPFAGDALAGHAHTTTATGSVSAPTFTGDAMAGHAHTTTATGSVSAPTFTGDAMAGHAHTTTATGSVSAPTFTGDAMGTHNHEISPTVNEVVAVAADTGTLALVPGLVQNVWAEVGAVTGAKTVIPVGKAPGAGQVAVNMTTGVLTFNAGDAVTEAWVTYTKKAVTSVSAGTPTGTNSAPTFTGNAVASDSVSAGTPSGTNSAPTFTGNAVASDSVSAGTPSGTNSAPTFTGNAVASDSVSGGTPSGTITPA